ncbi:cystatin-like [Labrus mixtus]|uniref:cystatin-like n=1 Tax=Labrus mixtus TaxID=508554 RepID=UPI0029C0BE39|nr:cystatin-like [Labrus mixtus]
MMWKLVFLVLGALFSVGVGAGGVVGGRDEIDLNQDVEARELLKSAVEEHNKKSNDMYYTMPQEVIMAEKQVVQGVKYFFTVNMGRTQCLKVDAKDNGNGLCVVHTDPDEAKPYQCSFTVWVRPWTSTGKQFMQTC